MWCLFGTLYYDNHNLSPHVYLIGIFDKIELAEKELNLQKKNNTLSKYYYFIKEIEINKVYDYMWSNQKL